MNDMEHEALFRQHEDEIRYLLTDIYQFSTTTDHIIRSTKAALRERDEAENYESWLKNLRLRELPYEAIQAALDIVTFILDNDFAFGAPWTVSRYEDKTPLSHAEVMRRIYIHIYGPREPMKMPPFVDFFLTEKGYEFAKAKGWLAKADIGGEIRDIDTGYHETT